MPPSTTRDRVGVDVLRQDACDRRRGRGGDLRRLAHHGVAGRDRRRHRGQQQLHGVVPRRDHQHHPERLAHHLGAARSEQQGHLLALGLDPAEQLGLQVLDLACRRTEVGGPRLERRATEVLTQGGDELLLALDEHPLQAGELLLAPRDRPGATGAVRRSQSREQLRGRGGGEVGIPLVVAGRRLDLGHRTSGWALGVGKVRVSVVPGSRGPLDVRAEYASEGRHGRAVAHIARGRSSSLSAETRGQHRVCVLGEW